ncbi:hypothetical protein [Candidatus Hydrogenosomobacter endosymbioticus]|uniref:Secreted protein n=1 Tax=Candidatus Hydrogenosomobacter endosymbioticus TaxID=2558174 RepID=A0ABM7V8Q1_9PROT|nr:hypothetical protein [Candidatus Hydrogenosomobacter endosymbioticus]BDB96171.1 hypothetical protein HYD_3040 [Candidatus Hydrogenosomobacter endosymbioticus]
MKKKFVLLRAYAAISFLAGIVEGDLCFAGPKKQDKQSKDNQEQVPNYSEHLDVDGVDASSNVAEFSDNEPNLSEIDGDFNVNDPVHIDFSDNLEFNSEKSTQPSSNVGDDDMLKAQEDLAALQKLEQQQHDVQQQQYPHQQQQEARPLKVIGKKAELHQRDVQQQQYPYQQQQEARPLKVIGKKAEQQQHDVQQQQYPHQQQQEARPLKVIGKKAELHQRGLQDSITGEELQIIRDLENQSKNQSKGEEKPEEEKKAQYDG